LVDALPSGKKEKKTSRRMKIVHVTPSFYPSTAYGGATDSTSKLCRALARAGADVRVLTTNADGPSVRRDVPLGKETDVDGLRVRYCERQGGDSISLGLLNALPGYLAWADVVHLMAVYSFPTLPALGWTRRFGKPLVWSPRGALDRWSGTRKKMGKSIWNAAAAFLAPKRLLWHLTSAEEEKGIQERWPEARTVVIPNGVEIPESVAHEDSPSELRVLFLGRLDPKKGVENLLRACRGASPTNLWQLTIAGAGHPAYEQSLRQLAEALGLGERVRFAGAVNGDAKENLFKKNDLLVAPSYTENFCVVVAEALAHGMPVVASRGTPWKDVETRGVGRWVDNDPESLNAAIEMMRGQPLRAMGDRGRAWMQAEFTWERAASRMMTAYQESIAA
jgi:glycosyltransferase involved in cell wall biosynthesis